MPLYEYECNGCGEISEAIQKFSDSPLQKCNHCSGKLRKLISSSSFHLKGGGWYVTDYCNDSTKMDSPEASSENKKVEDKSPAVSSEVSSEKVE